MIKTEKFACMRELFQNINEKNAIMRHLSPLIAIDQTLYPYCEHIRFNQHIPNKPAKYGLLSRSLCDFSIPHTYYTLPHAHRPEKVEGPAAKYCITRSDKYSKYLINELSVYCNIQGINVSIDSYFILISWTTWGLQKNISIVGNIKYD